MEESKKRKSEIYIESLWETHKATEKDIELYPLMKLKLGQEFKMIPEPKSYKEAFERLEKYSGQACFELLVKEFKPHNRNKRTISDQIKRLKEFIDSTESISTEDVLGKPSIYSPWVEPSKAEYLKITNEYYVDHYCDYVIGGLPCLIYGKYILYYQWLKGELAKLQDTQAKEESDADVKAPKTLLDVQPIVTIPTEDTIEKHLECHYRVYSIKPKKKPPSTYSEPSLIQIALLMCYLGEDENIKEHATEIVKYYGFNSGQTLIQRYSKVANQNLRRGTGLTKKEVIDRIKNQQKVVAFLSEICPENDIGLKKARKDLEALENLKAYE